jgi:hypothetical protein
MDTVHFAKILSTTGNACGLDRGHYDREIAKLAAATKLPGESPQQGYVRISTQTAEGRELFKAAVKAPAPKQAPQDFANPRPEAAGPASRELNELAAQMAKDKGISFQRAYYLVVADLSAFPARRELLERAKLEEQAATREVRDSRWPIRAAEREFERDWRSGSARVG